MTLPTFAAASPLLMGAWCPPLSIDISCLPARRSAADPPHAAAAVNDGTDRRTDGHSTIK